ncbi:SDR family oxidoreductase [Cohnella sp. GCM10027633]|uniref:SDR family oxidoreductase n=1 Tax=unclassified Cohnella TaxID=2636738 RepID=UPI00363C4B2B
MNHQSKIALVTGGSRGLGRDAALALARRGIAVVVTYHTQREQADLVVGEIERSGGRAAALRLDTGVVASFDGFVSELADLLRDKWNAERIDYLVNNAGIGASVPLASTTEEQFDSLMNVHLKGVFFLTQKLLPHLNDNGSIVNLSTGLTRFTIEGYGAYAAMKGAIEVLTKYMAKELGRRGIRVNAVAPGAIATDFNGGGLKASEEARKHIGSLIALGRVGEPEDIGGVIASLVSDEMGWVNGQRIEASGGMNL